MKMEEVREVIDEHNKMLDTMTFEEKEKYYERFSMKITRENAEKRKKYTHLKINVGEKSFITSTLDIKKVKDRIEFLKNSCEECGITDPSNYYAVLDAIENGDYEFINMDEKPSKTKNLKKNK